MNSRMLRILAVLLAAGSLLVGYAGYQLSQRPANDEHKAAAARTLSAADAKPVVIALVAIAPGHSIRAEDLALVGFPVQPPATFSEPEGLIGKTPTLPIAAGEAPLERHFLPGSSLARAVQPGERAIAVKVDEVVAGGGLVQPGDYVDVLWYLRGGSQEVPKSSAQTVLRQVRVLAYGEAVVDEEKASGAQGSTGAGRSAVLAVPLEHANALMLAASAGSLRLAVYGVQERQAVAAGTYAASSQEIPVTLGDLARQSKAAPKQAQRAATVSLFHGARKEVIEPR